MKFDDASAVEMVCYDIKLSDYPRGRNRALINNLFNGVPPFDETQAEANRININVNFLEGTALSHDARAQFYGAFIRPGQFFNATTDFGPKARRNEWNTIVTGAVNKIMKRNLVYFETLRSKFAMDILHGIGPSAWRDQDEWCPRAAGIEDVGIPANTLLTLENLPFFYVYRSFTYAELYQIVNKPKVDAGWNKKLVKECLKWLDEQSMQLMGQNWPEVWSPEKTAERVKGDTGFYAADQVPTIDCFDFYFWNDEDDIRGWNRRIILDAWSTPEASGGKLSMLADQDLDFARNQFLYNPGKRKYAAKHSEIISFQFADLSAVAPFRYHSVRSLGFLVYAVCHLQNRMRCKFNESVFEALMNYFRVRSQDDVDRALMVDMMNRGYIDETVQFVPPTERWQVDTELVMAGLAQNNETIMSHSSRFTSHAQTADGSTGDRKTRFQVMAEIQQASALVGSAFNQAYVYQEAEYREIFRRFCKKNSNDPEVKQFRLLVQKAGLPNDMLDAALWDIQSTRVMGNGNQTLELAIAQQLLEMRDKFDPDPQQEILRDITFAVTGDADRALRWVPPEPEAITDSVHNAQIAMGTLMQGLPVMPKTGDNHEEYVEVYLKEMGFLVKQALQGGSMASMSEIKGFAQVATAVQQHLKILAADKDNKAFVAAAAKDLSKLMNHVRAFAQRLQQQSAQANGQNGGMDAETKGKIAASLITAKAKADNTKEAHAQRTAQRQVAFEMEEKRKQVAFDNEQARLNLETHHEQNRLNLEAVEERSRNLMQSLNQNEGEEE